MKRIKTIKDLQRCIKKSEGPSLEFKRSTGELKEALQTLCAFLNGNGGTLIFGVTPKGAIEGQQVSDKTLRDITQALDKFEPSINISPHLLKIDKEKSVIIFQVEGKSISIPFVYDGRPYERVSSSTRKMPKTRYEQLLIDRMHKTRRWENLPAIDATIKDIDQDEVFRIIRIAESLGRFHSPIGRNVLDILRRLQLCNQNGQIYQGAVVLFGEDFLPNYPQCELRMARFRGTDKTEFLDQKNVRAPAFKLLEEAEIFCQRHFPLPAKIVPTQMRRLEKPLIPPEAMREILVNALIHRDYSIVGGSVSLAIFDDRVEVWSIGGFPKGITPAMLSKNHPSVQRNPTIADVFHRTGLIEKWGRGTNRVIEMCQTAGLKPPKFEEIGESALVTFHVNVGVTRQVTPQDTPQVTPQVKAVLESARQPRSRDELQAAVDIKDREHFRKKYLLPLIQTGWLEMTIPDKPNSRLQKYRLTTAGAKAVRKKP